MCSFFFNDTATTEIYTLSLHDALPIWAERRRGAHAERELGVVGVVTGVARRGDQRRPVLPESGAEQQAALRSEEHTSELQSRQYLVCRLLLEKKKRVRRIGLKVHSGHY